MKNGPNPLFLESNCNSQGNPKQEGSPENEAGLEESPTKQLKSHRDASESHTRDGNISRVVTHGDTSHMMEVVEWGEIQQ